MIIKPLPESDTVSTEEKEMPPFSALMGIRRCTCSVSALKEVSKKLGANSKDEGGEATVGGKAVISEEVSG